MIKIVHIITDLYIGGAEMMLYKLMSNMDRSRFDPIVISLMDKGSIGKEIEALGIPVHKIDMTNRKSSISALWRLSNLLYKIKPDIIQGWMYHGNLAASISRLLYFKKVPLIWNIRHSLYDINYEKKHTALIITISAYISKIAVNIIYNSQKSANQHEKLGYKVDRTTIIPNGFDCELFKPSPTARFRLREELAINENDILIGLIGRFHPMKDHANFIEAAGILAKKYPNVRFVLAGRDINKENHAITELIKNNLISKQTYLLGERKDTPELNACLDIACSASSYGEAFPNVLGEAMACGVPCVATDVGGSAWIIGETGKIVPPRNAKALAGAWELLIEVGKEERQQLGKKARERILENFTLKKIVHQYETLYESVNNNMIRKDA